MALSAFAYFGIFGLLFFGALNTLTTKIQFTMKSEGTAGDPNKPFEKPVFAVFTMFVAMACVLFWHYATKLAAKRKQRQQASLIDKGDPFLDKSQSQEQGASQLKSFFLVGIPATLDLVATGMMFYGLLVMDASMYQMLRGAMIIFSAIVSVPLLGKKLYRFHWAGVLACVVGITCVGASNLLNQSGGDSGPQGVTPEQSAMGIVLVLAAQAVQATQVVVEEKFLREVKMEPLMIVGFEGIWGTLECIFLIFPLISFMPGEDNGKFEDTIDTLVMLSNSVDLQILVLVYIFSCSTYNIAGMAVTSSFSAVHRTMLEASRTAVIWSFDLIIHYGVDKSIPFGEAWLPYSWLQMVGFFTVVAGQMIYGEVIKLPGFHYPINFAQVDAGGFKSPTQMMMTSPLPPSRED
jgi:drug/metabolite transporter (DMT)-like permease